MVEMELLGVKLELPSNTPVVMLKEADGPRVVPIFIGLPEANAIAFALDGVETPRPLTHDLFKDVLDELGVRLEQVVITDLSEGTFFADLHLRTADGGIVVTSRPSDAIALAVRAGSPIYAAESVLDEAGTVVEDAPEEAGESEDVVAQFREFIDQVDPEDFAS
jgi:bifunctional DNase/RNase